MASEVVLDIVEAQFQTEVLDKSKELPVVVDFWAPWCGPCRMLGPLLEKEAEARAGQVRLIKVNTDEAPSLSTRFNIRGIPAVKAFRNGRVVSEFVGAQPQTAVRAFFDRLMPNPDDQQVEKAMALEKEGRGTEAKRLFAEVLERNPRHGAALLGLVRTRAAAGVIDEALNLLDRLPPEFARSPEALRLGAELRLRAEASALGSKEAVQEALAKDDSDLAARYGVALHAGVEGRYQEALDGLLEVIRRDRNWRDGAARRAILQIFDLVGTRSEVAESARQRLASLLY